ncbi:unnamed protein product [Haemonchus placei]|uniref:Uncharacterized protein n=1 Tax=Haemonchus placei TaxID=6290 RepID=A0A0N4WP55_HAEPC|nr:unnamed protein product [Haemonchus placei]
MHQDGRKFSSIRIDLLDFYLRKKTIMNKKWLKYDFKRTVSHITNDNTPSLHTKVSGERGGVDIYVHVLQISLWQ